MKVNLKVTQGEKMAQTKKATKNTSARDAVQGGADVDIDPDVLERLRAAEPHRKRLQALIDEAGVVQREAAQLIAEQTMRPCSLRSISSWLAGPESPSNARPCPEWAVHALEARLKARLARQNRSLAAKVDLVAAQAKAANGKAAESAKADRSASGMAAPTSRKVVAKKSARRVGKSSKVA